MFRKKTDIPPRPKIPSVGQILDDIEHSTPQDIAFQTPLEEDLQLNTKDCADNPEAVYQKVKDFVEINTTLKEVLQKLQDEAEALKISDLELKAMADDIRKQALEALQ